MRDVYRLSGRIVKRVLFAMENVTKVDMRCLGLKKGEACESKIAGRSTICKAKACSILRGNHLPHHKEYATLIAAPNYVGALDYRDWCINIYKEDERIVKMEEDAKREKKKIDEEARQQKKLAKAQEAVASLKDRRLATQTTLDYANGVEHDEDYPDDDEDVSMTNRVKELVKKFNTL
jgi:hypothetical protein